MFITWSNLTIIHKNVGIHPNEFFTNEAAKVSIEWYLETHHAPKPHHT